jgi:anthranilate phosphoribosyltransferase
MKIAKHGNRGATSLCGSADVLEALGVRVELSAAAVETCINEVGIGFMFAPAFHTAFKNVQRIRRLLAAQTPPQLHARTVFNVLGPLANPAAPARQLIGVYSADLVPKLADALQLLGLQRALVAFGHCDGATTGLDELSTLGRTSLAELHESGDITISDITPEAVGLSRDADPDALRGADPQANAEILTRLLAGREVGARLGLTLLNAGAGLYLGGVGSTIREGVEYASDILRSGEALQRLAAFRAITNDLASVV